jgi:hypothetical protein
MFNVNFKYLDKDNSIHFLVLPFASWGRTQGANRQVMLFRSPSSIFRTRYLLRFVGASINGSAFRARRSPTRFVSPYRFQHPIHLQSPIQAQGDIKDVKRNPWALWISMILNPAAIALTAASFGVSLADLPIKEAQGETMDSLQPLCDSCIPNFWYWEWTSSTILASGAIWSSDRTPRSPPVTRPSWRTAVASVNVSPGPRVKIPPTAGNWIPELGNN